MVDMSFHDDPNLEHRTTHAKWVRGVTVVYGCAALLLLIVAIAV
jgi:hypothetical protein